MSIAEQMGRTLQKTSVSLNIRERLDFSCAIFGPEGGLVANAPHVPVHLGSMQNAVVYQHKLHLGKLKDGDVLLTNHPRKYLPLQFREVNSFLLMTGCLILLQRPVVLIFPI